VCTDHAKTARRLRRGSNFGGALIATRPVTMYGYGTAVRDYVYTDDVVDAFMFAGQLPLEVTGTYNIGTGEQTTVSEVYRLDE
jgi:UDP-glucose 4-epimerase